MNTPSSPILIRSETPADHGAIALVTAAAFAAARHSSGRETRIIEALRAAGQLHVSLVAEDRGAIVGHVAISPVRIPGEPGAWYGLGPLSVAPGLQRRGVGSRLTLDALASTRSGGAHGCVVLGDPAFYGRFGFRAQEGLHFPGAPPEYFLAIVWSGRCPRGEVSYAPAFCSQESTRGSP